ncbi:inositol monophosphatase family protein [Tunicatimonas pelagia]|uniref:inositol monophosphatase family protein n=1 Tax=Tunicatimonas pelagia TaxID=931531 RepID=UPI0026650B5C|nr:inositol monophosphatase family protein [Tunicatimonas pelagia]WKN45713.1 inositol monophosphatase family protein [Tunicatimonas pelagia]
MDIQQVLSQTLTTVKEVGRFIWEENQKFSLSEIEYKGKNDLVSYVDKEAEKRLVAQLSKILPEAGFITEEGTADVGKADRYNWVIDPVDGTTNYVHNLPFYSISIGLMEGDEVILGVIYEPNRDEMFYATKNGKACLNKQEIQVSPVETLEESLLATGFPYSKFREMPAYIDVVQDLMQQTHGLRRMGSAALDLAYVACGRFEGFFEYNLKPWDVAAGTLIVQQAGGSVTTFTGTDNYIFGGELVAGCAIRSDLMEVIKKHWYSGKDY